MREKLALAIVLSIVAISANAGRMTETEAGKAVRPSTATSGAQSPQNAEVDAYLQWHRDSGYAIYASPLEAIAPDTHLIPDACAKTGTVPVN